MSVGALVLIAYMLVCSQMCVCVCEREGSDSVRGDFCVIQRGRRSDGVILPSSD